MRNDWKWKSLDQCGARQVLVALPALRQGASAVYSTACFKSCTTNTASFWGVRIGHLSLKAYLGLWYFQAVCFPFNLCVTVSTVCCLCVL